MQALDWFQLGLLLLCLVLLAKPIGLYLASVLDPKEKTCLDVVLKPVETFIYRCLNVDPFVEHTWKVYLLNILGFSVVAVCLTSLLLAIQYYLPLNPQELTGLSWDLNFNTTLSFMTNSNWQSYSGEKTLSYFSQMAALSVQNFTSAAVGLATAATLVRGIARQAMKTVGNFWADLVRICLYLFLPLCILAAGLFISEGVPQNFKPYTVAATMESGQAQTIVQGPIASQQAIKLIGTNGGGYTNVNSAHPYENPTPLSNFVQLLLILLIPTAQLYYYGHAVKDPKHGWCIFAALAAIFVIGVWVCASAEIIGNPQFANLGLTGGNWEGKEQRFGIFTSSLYACAATASSCGSVISSHDSLTPMGGLVPMLNIQLGEVIFGGVGSGLYSVLLFVFLAIFISGLIIGRTPEYLGKKIESFDIQMTMLAVIPLVFIVHGFTSLACFTNWGVEQLGNSGPHGFSEILYAFSSAAGNNGSAFAGLEANTIGYNLSLGIATLLGRFLIIVPVLALAGSFGHKKIHPKNSGSFPVSSFVFVTLLVGIILLLGALTFLPAISMGPIIEQFYLLKGVLSP